MPANHKQQSRVLNEILSIWKESNPIEGYAAGLPGCRGRLFIPDEASKACLECRIKKVKLRLGQIKTPDLRKAAGKILDSISVGLLYDRPDGQILTCAMALWYPILKGEAEKPFVKSLLKQAVTILELEYDRWKDQRFSGEMCKAGVDAIAFLTTVLSSVAKQNPEARPAIKELRKWIRKYKVLFPVPVTSDLTQLFKFFKTHPGPPLGKRAYQDIVNRLFDYGASATEIRTHGHAALEEELALIKDLMKKLPKRFVKGRKSGLGTVYGKVIAAYPIKGNVVKEAQKMMKVLDRFIDRYVQDLGAKPNVVPEEAPGFLEPLITSGATLVLDYIKRKPLVYIYVVKGRNKSWLTLLNLLVHEATHAYHPLLLAREPSVPLLAKLRTYLLIPFSEAAAFHRELQLFEAFKEESKRRWGLNRVRRGLLRIFDSTKFSLEDDLNAFELETRVWRVIRALRTICDVEVNCGIRTYVEFVEWASAKTTLSKQLIHDECFTFLALPGYSPAYSFCGKHYEDLESDAMATRMSRLAFNTKAHKMGLWPWTICVEKMEKFKHW